MLLSDVILAPDTRANQPAANTVPVGTLYYVTDEQVLERSTGAAWQTYSGSGGAAGSGDWEFFQRATIIVQRTNSTGNSYEAIGAQTTISLFGSGGISLVYDGAQSYTQCLSAASAGSGHGVVSAFSWVARDMEPMLDVIVRSPDVLTAVRMWVGLMSTTPTNADDPPNNSAGFRFSSVAADTGWTPVTRDGATSNVGTTIGTVAAGTLYWLRIRCDATGVHFSVDGGAEQTLSANLPTGTTFLGLASYGFPTTGAARSNGFVRARCVYGEPAPGA